MHFAANGSQVQDLNYGVFNSAFAGKGLYTIDLAVSIALTTAAVVDNFIANLYKPALAPFTEPSSYN